MSIESSGGEEMEGALIDQKFPGMVDASAHTADPTPTTFLQSVFLRNSSQSEVGHTTVTANTPPPDENAGPQSLTATTSTTRTSSGSSGSIATHQRPSTSTDLTSIRSPGFPLDKKPIEQHDAQPEEGPCSSTSMRAMNGSDTGASSDSDKSNKKKEPAEFIWNISNVGSQFSGDDQPSSTKHADARARTREVIVYQDLEESVHVAQAFAEIRQQNASLQSKIDVMESKIVEIELQVKIHTRHQYVQTSLLVAIVFIGGIIAWKI